MTDKIIILAGGISSRMKKQRDGIELDPELIKDADEKPKGMIRVGDNDRPFLDYLLINIVKAGLNEVVIVIGENDYSIVDYYSKDSSAANVFEKLKFYFPVQPIPKGREKPIGTADALWHGLNAVPFWKGDSFLVCNSDNLYSVEAIQMLMNSEHPNALIDYNRDGLKFDIERISRFAITRKNKKGFLNDIIEKPSEEFINSVKAKDGYIGVSMNIFKFNFDMIYPLLESTPLHPVRNEKEIPSTVKILIGQYSDSLYAYKMNEHVPDLTSKEDILPVIQYLKNEYKYF